MTSVPEADSERIDECYRAGRQILEALVELDGRFGDAEAALRVVNGPLSRCRGLIERSVPWIEELLIEEPAQEVAGMTATTVPGALLKFTESVFSSLQRKAITPQNPGVSWQLGVLWDQFDGANVAARLRKEELRAREAIRKSSLAGDQGTLSPDGKVAKPLSIYTTRGKLRGAVPQILRACEAIRTQEEIAAEIKMNRSTVARFTPALVEEGMLQTKQGGGFVRTEKALEALQEEGRV